MRSVQEGASEEAMLWELESDLPSLASQAAIELDNLILGRSSQVEAIRRLALRIGESVERDAEPASALSRLDPKTVVVIKRAIDDALRLNAPLTTVDELVHETGKIRERLERVSQNPQALQQHGIDSLKQMRAFCLALSRRASAHEQSMDDRKPPHPFRR